MKADFQPDELLPLSGIQHFVFCRRQWALIHVEQQWQNNYLTTKGKLMHERVDNPFFTETRGGGIITRSMPVASYRLGLIGVCDVVEFLPSPDGIKLKDREGLYLPIPVEYKSGHEKWDRCDEAQLCAQSLCLEEMLLVQVPYGNLYYGETRHRTKIVFDSELRAYVIRMIEEMHSYFDRGYTPRVKPLKACKSCSLQDECLPNVQGKTLSASKYIELNLEHA